MQWAANASAAGFRTGKPWLPIPNNLAGETVSDELTDHSSDLNLYRALFALRSEGDILRAGDYETGESNKDIFSYKRSSAIDNLQVILNFSDQSHDYALEYSGTVLLSSEMTNKDNLKVSTVTLEPYEGIIVRIDKESY